MEQAGENERVGNTARGEAMGYGRRAAEDNARWAQKNSVAAGVTALTPPPPVLTTSSTTTGDIVLDMATTHDELESIHTQNLFQRKTEGEKERIMSQRFGACVGCGPGSRKTTGCLDRRVKGPA